MAAVLEFDHPSGIDVDQMVMVAMLGRLVAGARPAEIVALQDALFLQQPHRAVDGGDGDLRVEGGGAAVQLLHVGMVRSLGEDTGDHAALPGHLEPALDAQTLDPALHGTNITGGRGASANAASLGQGECRVPRRAARLAAPATGIYLRVLRGLVPRPMRLARDERWLA